MGWKLCGTAFDRGISDFSECPRRDPSAPNKSRKITSYIKCYFINFDFLLDHSFAERPENITADVFENVTLGLRKEKKQEKKKKI